MWHNKVLSLAASLVRKLEHRTFNTATKIKLTQTIRQSLCAIEAKQSRQKSMSTKKYTVKTYEYKFKKIRFARAQEQDAGNERTEKRENNKTSRTSARDSPNAHTHNGTELRAQAPPTKVARPRKCPTAAQLANIILPPLGDARGPCQLSSRQRCQRTRQREKWRRTRLQRPQEKEVGQRQHKRHK